MLSSPSSSCKGVRMPGLFYDYRTIPLYKYWQLFSKRWFIQTFNPPEHRERSTAKNCGRKIMLFTKAFLGTTFPNSLKIPFFLNWIIKSFKNISKFSQIFWFLVRREKPNARFVNLSKNMKNNAFLQFSYESI